MDYATIIKAGSKVAKAAARYIDKDLHTYYGLAKPAWVSFKGPGVGVLGRSLEVRQVIVGVLSIEFESADKVYMSAVPFEASTKLFNGPNLIPDNLGDGSKEMSLWHDLTWEYAKQIASFARGGVLPVPEPPGEGGHFSRSNTLTVSNLSPVKSSG